MKYHTPKWIKRTLIAISGITFILLILHFFLNSESFQQYALKTLNRHLDVELNWDKLHFVALMGHFEGNNLSVTIPKANTKIQLMKVTLAIDPMQLIFKKFRLLNLEADDLLVKIYDLPESNLVERKTTSESMMHLLNLFQAKKAKLTNVRIELPHETTASLNRLEINSRTPFLFYKQAYEVTLDQIMLHSPKMDLFLKSLLVSGSFDVNYDKQLKELNPSFDGRLLGQAILIGFNKTPTPWNTSPAWDNSLTPVLEHHYPNGIPENRGFAYIDNLHIPVEYKANLIQVKNGHLITSGGSLALHAYWNKRTGKTKWIFRTAEKLQMSLLPLGKANLKNAFGRVNLVFSGEGMFKRLNEGNLQGILNLDLEENHIIPALDKMSLSLNPTFTNGIIKIPDLKILLGEGTANGHGEINLIEKNLNMTLIAQKLDTQTIVRLFSSIDIPGSANLQGTVSGSLKKPTFDFKLSSPHFGYEGLTFGSFDGSLVIRDNNLSLTGTSNLEGQGNGSLDLKIVEVFKPSRQTVSLKTSYVNLPAGPLLKTDAISGNVNGFFNMTKNKGDYDGEGLIEATNIMWYKIPISKATGKLQLTDKILKIQPISFSWGADEPGSLVNQPLVFNFTKDGYDFNGNILPNVSLRGLFRKDDPTHLMMKFTANNTSLKFLSSVMPFEIKSFTTSGDFDVLYTFSAPKQTKIGGHISQLTLEGDEKEIRLNSKAQIDLENQKITFSNTSWTYGQGKLNLNGVLGLEEGSNLKINGTLDLFQLSGLHPWIIEGSGLAETDIVLTGSPKQFSFDGRMDFKESALLFRALRGELTDIIGRVEFQGKRVQFQSTKALYDEAPITLNGWLEWSPLGTLAAADLALTGEEISLSRPDTWHLLTDADISLKGSGGGLTLTGTLNVVEGLYYKDYNLTQFLLKPIGVSHDENYFSRSTFFENIIFDLSVKSSGDFVIKNNLADLALLGNLDITGNISKPILNGTIDVVEGELHAFGLDFEDARGFITFHPSKEKPLIEFVASHEIQDYEVRANIRGYSDNLALELESTPDLSQNEIVSLVAYGRTPDQLSQTDQNFFTTSAIASQIVGLFQRPLSKATKLDIVRLETEYDENTPTVSRFSIGKTISDRVAIAFTTDLSLDEAYKGFSLEYRLLDNLLLKSTKDTGSRYRFDLAWRFQAY